MQYNRSSLLHSCLQVALLFSWGFVRTRAQCTKDEYKRCVTLADPLLQDPHLIYPDNMRDIDHVCRTWGFFVDCVKRFTDRCFTETKKKEFSKAVESPVDSVHQMCTMPLYQEEYLKHAACMKATLVEENRCGRHYKHLVNQVAGEAARPTLCCSHHRFRECVLDQTRRTCQPDATPYAKQILDKALSFLKDQCSNYIPTEIDCPGADFYTQPPVNRPGNWKDVVRTTLPPWLESAGGRGPTGHPWVPVSTGGVPMDPTRTSYTRAMSGSGATTEVNHHRDGGSTGGTPGTSTQQNTDRDGGQEPNRPERPDRGGNRPDISSSRPDNRPDGGSSRPDNRPDGGFSRPESRPSMGTSRPDSRPSSGRPNDFDNPLGSDTPWTPQISNSIDEEEKPNQQGLANGGVHIEAMGVGVMVCVGVVMRGL
uniref:Uncharacterized protein n=1 Tax=Cacopsylla melanoneura TaxID=428564 RepID=A0A8D8VNS9_9HEMI